MAKSKKPYLTTTSNQNYEDRSNKPELIVTKGREQNDARVAIRILKDSGANIFLHGDQLVRAVRFMELDTKNKQVQRDLSATILRPVTPIWLMATLQDMADVKRFDAREKKFTKTNVPHKVLEIISDLPEWGQWPRLKSIVKTPLLLPDGSWIGTPGYHNTPWGGFYLDIDSDGEWQEPGQTKDEAEDAMAEVLKHFQYMAWADDLSRAVALSALLTAIMRPVLDTAPMHIMDAPVPGTGKSLLANAVSVITSGGRAASISYSHKDEENEKRMDALLMAGDNMIIIDNVSVPLQGDMLNQILTEQTRKTRVLGESKIVSLPCTPFIMATGNNIVIKGDLVRRCVICRLDAHEEDPENRDIPQNLLSETHQNRKQLVYWLQTIMRGYIVSCQQNPDECQSDVHNLGSFESWTPIRQTLLWLGQFDPVETIRKNKDNDPDRNNMLTLYTEWHNTTTEPIKTSNLIRLSEMHPELREALLAVASDKGTISNRRLGYWLRNHRDIPISGLILYRTGSAKRPHWQIVKQ